ncbi:MAG: MarR family transcriptional regulator [Burkholderiaceae bacterium]|nr:MarR family transcriptional regulator [Aquabacterium sp.]NUP87687.1 MarR family transcriptional regulator [Burkholderiaceae bacterium]
MPPTSAKRTSTARAATRGTAVRARPAAPRNPVAARGDDPLARFDFRTGSLGYTLRLAQVRLYGLFFEMLGDLGLTPARVTALSIIATDKDMNQARLARSLDIAGPSALKMVDALEAAGLICRLAVEGDRRRYALALTASGRDTIELLRQRLAEYEERIAAALSPAEREQLIALLNRTALASSPAPRQQQSPERGFRRA